MGRTINVYLSERHSTFLADELASGRAQNATEVVRRGLELALRERELHEAKLMRLRQEVGAGLTELDKGEVHESSAEEVLAAARELRRTRRR
jgi:antitoxin ParD1/3/4